MKKIKLLAIVHIYCAVVISQEIDFNNYTPLASKGNIPQEFYTSAEEKVQKYKHKYSRGRDAKYEKEFYNKSSYFLNRYFCSGNLVFGDKVTNYIRAVADEVYKNDPIREKISIYTSKDASVNTFIHPGGKIFVNIGLIAQLENEAQLAYILAHEINHYKNNHLLDAYLEKQDIIESEEDYKDINTSDREKAYFSFSKIQEKHADEKALEDIFKTDYSSFESIGAMNILKYSYLPFDQIEFDLSFLEREDYKFSDKLKLEEIKSINVEEYDDSKSTHPNIRKRIEAIESLLEKKGESGEEFIVGEETFYLIRKIARYELINLYIIRRDYYKSAYCAYMLLQDEPDNDYLQRSMGYSLYALAKHKNFIHNIDTAENIREYTYGSRRYEEKKYKNLFEFIDYNKIEGSSQPFYYFINKLEPVELASIAVRYNWELSNEHPENEYLQELADSSLKELVLHNKIEKGEYFRKTQKELLKTTDTTKAAFESLSKYEKIAKKKEIEEVTTNKSFHKFTFVNLFKDEKFTDKFNHFITLRQEKEAKEDNQNLGENLQKEKERRKNEKKLIKKKGLALGINKMVVVNPFHYRIDIRDDDDYELKYHKSEKRRLEYFNLLNFCANKIKGFSIETIHPLTLRPEQVNDYNNYSRLQQWHNELYNQRSPYITFLSSQKPFVSDMKDIYNTSHFLWTTYYNSIDNNVSSLEVYYAIISFGLTIPFLIDDFIKSNHNLHFAYHLYDINQDEDNGKKLYDYSVFSCTNDANDHLKSIIYDYFYQTSSNR